MLPKRQTTNPPPVKLSEVVARPGAHAHSKRLNLSGLRITLLDSLPDQYRNLQELILKNNMLEGLGEIAQFADLRVLDLSNNRINDQKELLKLAALRNLEVLQLTGNPLLQTRLTNEVLAVLDQLHVELSVEATWDAQKPDEERRLENVLLDNYIELVFLQNLYRKTEMHLELVKRSTLDLSEQSDYRVLLRHKDAILEPDESISNKYVQQLRLDAYALKKTLNLPDVVAAYRDLVERQCRRKAELLTLIQERNSQLKTVLAKSRKATAATSSKSNLKIPLLPKQGNLAVNAPESKNTNQATEQCRKKARVPLSEQEYQAHYYKNLTKRHPVYHLLYSPLHSLKPKEKDLLIQTLSSHLKEKSIELHRKEEQIRALEETHKQKVEELAEQARLANQQKNQLARRLLQYETTVTDFHFDGKVRSDKEASGKQAELAEAKVNNQLYKEMYQRVCEGVQHMAQVERKQQILREIANRKAKTRYFFLLYNKSLKFGNLRALHSLNEQRSSKKLVTKCFALLKRASVISRIIKLKKREKEKIFLEEAFYGWVHYLLTERKQRSLARNLRLSKIFSRLKLLSLNATKSKIRKLKNQKATRHYRFALVVKAWKAVLSEWVKHNDHTLMPMIKRTEQFYNRKLISKVFLQWANTHQVDMFKRAEKQREVDRILLKKYTRKPFAAWYNDYYGSRSNIMAKEMLLERMQRVHSTENLLKRFFRSGKENVLQSKRNKKRLMSLFEKARNLLVFGFIDHKVKQFYFESKKSYEKGMSLVVGLRRFSQRYLGHKLAKLRSSLSTSRVKTFFGFYHNIKTQRKQLNLSVRNLRASSQVRVLSRVFNSWRYHSTRELLVSERDNINPLIQDLRTRQQHYLKLNQILKDELAAKDEKLKLYDKKIQNLSFQMTNRDLKYEKLFAAYEISMAEMKAREKQFMDTIGNLQGKFELVSAEVDQLAKEEIKKEYQAKRHSPYSRVALSDFDSTIRRRRGRGFQQ